MHIYKTTNLINNKIYIGLSKHPYEQIPDYLGSGVLILKAIEKYGRENFKKELLEECKTKNKLISRERYWIKELKSRDQKIGYNICEGGQWGDNWEFNKNKKKFGKRRSELMSGKNNINFGNHKSWEEKYGKEYSEELKKLASKRWLGRKHSKKTIKECREQKLGLGNPNSVLWLVENEENKKKYLVLGGIKNHLKFFRLKYYQMKNGYFKPWLFKKIAKNTKEFKEYSEIIVQKKEKSGIIEL